MIYVINDEVLFDEEKSTLYLNDYCDDVIIISNPARRLLLLLIEYHGQIVTREKIFFKVWEEFGLTANNNNLNQCVSRLRKSFNDIGLVGNFIITVPKVGFMMSHTLKIQPLSNENKTINDFFMIMECESNSATSLLPIEQSAGRAMFFTLVKKKH